MSRFVVIMTITFPQKYPFTILPFYTIIWLKYWKRAWRPFSWLVRCKKFLFKFKMAGTHEVHKHRTIIYIIGKYLDLGYDRNIYNRFCLSRLMNTRPPSWNRPVTSAGRNFVKHFPQKGALTVKFQFHVPILYTDSDRYALTNYYFIVDTSVHVVHSISGVSITYGPSAEAGPSRFLHQPAKLINVLKIIYLIYY